jgi:hypothetical protein
MDVLGLQSSKVNIRNQLLHNYVCLIVGGVEVVGRSGVGLNGGNPKGGGTCPPGGDPHGGGGACCPGGDPHDGGGTCPPGGDPHGGSGK